jgi:perosamine synthetase
VAAFEESVTRKVGAQAGVAVSSCTTGLHLVLHALGIGSGDEVITPSLSFIASANAPLYVGATPVFADVDPITMNLTVDTIEPVITDRTRAVILVHQLGMPADIDPVRELCDANGIVLIEDAACAIGSSYQGKPIGSRSPYVVFSFHPRKVITTGEGGMIMTNDGAEPTRLRALRQHAMTVSAFDRHESDPADFESYPEMGFNFRMTDIQAAIGSVQLSKLDQMVQRRRQLAAQYRERLGGVTGVILPHDPRYGETNYQSFCIELEPSFGLNRNDLIRHLHQRGIASRRGVMASHLESAFPGSSTGTLPVTERLTARTILLPLYHQMTDSDMERVTEAVAEAAVSRV